MVPNQLSYFRGHVIDTGTHYSKCSVNGEKKKEKMDNEDDEEEEEGSRGGRKERKGPAYTTQKLQMKDIKSPRET